MPRKIKWKNVASNLVLALGGLLLLYPLVYAVAVGFMTKEDFATYPPTLLPIPRVISLRNYRMLLTGYGNSMIKFYFLNSLLRSIWYVLTTIVTSLVGGYVFARMKFRGRDILFLGLLATQMLPPVIALTPTYIMMARFPLVGGNNILGAGGTGFIDKYPVLFILGLVNVLGIFLVRQSVQQSPVEMEEAARVDGATTLRIIFQIVAPVNAPVLAYIAITTGINVWNDWFTPFIYLNTERYQTLASAISKLTSVAIGQYGVPDWPYIITLGLGLTVPCLIFFAFCQRYIVEGLASAAIKG